MSKASEQTDLYQDSATGYTFVNRIFKDLSSRTEKGTQELQFCLLMSRDAWACFSTKENAKHQE